MGENGVNGGSFTVQPECFPCFMRQAVFAIGKGTRDEEVTFRILKAVVKDMRDADVSLSPAHATSHMHRRIRDMLGLDPFEDLKVRYTDEALSLYPRLKQVVAGSEDRVSTAARLAIAGNVIDFGIYSEVDIAGTVERALNEPLAVDHSGAFGDSLDSTGKVLYLLDNAGESVFDRILIEELIEMGKTVIAVAKGGPVINDCTRADARRAGIDSGAILMDSGSDAVGTILRETSREFRELFENESVFVISKGQGNFETLLQERRPIAFLFQSKCDVLSRFLGLPKGSMILHVGGGE
jgi:uncharacterized protein with ATP-grasp and redox domains